MNSKFVFGLLLFIVFTLHQGNAIKCFRCDGEKSCKKPSSVECNQFYANETSRYLDAYFLNVKTNLTSSSFSCMRQNMQLGSGKIDYKGCIYSNMFSCGYTLRPFYQSATKYDCHQCNNRNGCNPADRTTISSIAIFLSLFAILIYKNLM